MACMLPVRKALRALQSVDWLRLLPALVTIVIIAGLAGAFFLVPPAREFAQEAWRVLTSEDQTLIKGWVAQFGFWGVAVLLVFFLVQMFAFVLPSWLLIIVSVLAYGPVAGGIIALAGIALAATVAYSIGRLFSEVTVQKLVGEKSEKKIRLYLEKYGFWTVVIFRLAPFLSNDVISYVAGLVAMSYSRFLLATALGIAPLITLIAILGKTNERLRNGFIIVSIVSIIGLVIYIWRDRGRRPRTGV